jgi:hypothetical protein
MHMMGRSRERVAMLANERREPFAQRSTIARLR